MSFTNSANKRTTNPPHSPGERIMLTTEQTNHFIERLEAIDTQVIGVIRETITCDSITDKLQVVDNALVLLTISLKATNAKQPDYPHDRL